MRWIASLLASTALCALQVDARSTRDYYEILGITTSASAKEIKQAYRTKAKEYHPDASTIPNATEIFQEISEAYEVLSDEEQRDVYDQYGTEGLERMGQGGGGGGDGFGSSWFQSHRVVPKTVVPMLVTLEDLFVGISREMLVDVERLCSKANKCQKKRDDCAGSGMKVELKRVQTPFGMMHSRTMAQDETCTAAGIGWTPNCSYCPGGIYSREQESISVTVPPGASSGEKIRFAGQGRDRLGSDRGDLIVKLVQVPHKVYDRRGNDLHVSVSIKLPDALTGMKIKLPNPNGDQKNPLVIERNYPVSQGETQVFQNLGMPRKGRGRGSLIITHNVLFPESLDPSKHNAIRDLFKGVDNWKSSFAE